jgi:ABC-type uncharacterized transport system YnjBCD permease subunit
MSIVFALVFIVILGALAAAGYFMLRSSGQDSGEADQAAKNSRMARALTIRIGVSVVLFICVLIAWKFGYLKPTGFPVGK